MEVAWAAESAIREPQAIPKQASLVRTGGSSSASASKPRASQRGGTRYPTARQGASKFGDAGEQSHLDW